MQADEFFLGRLSLEYPVRTDEVGPEGRVMLPSLFLYMQDAAARHAELLGFGVAELASKGRGWVLSRLRMKMESYPSWGDEVVVETWPVGLERLFAMRNYLLKDGNGKELGQAESSWLVIDLESRRPVRFPRELVTLGSGAYREVFDSLPDDTVDGYVESDRLEVQVGTSDIDFNRHVNHVRYIEWMFGTRDNGVPGHPRELEIQFLSECIEGDHVVSRTGARPGSNSGALIHTLRAQEGNRTLAVGRSLPHPL